MLLSLPGFLSPVIFHMSSVYCHQSSVFCFHSSLPCLSQDVCPLSSKICLLCHLYLLLQFISCHMSLVICNMYYLICPHVICHVTVQYRFPAKWLFVTPDVSILNQLVEEVAITATLECRKLGLCGSDAVLFGLSTPLNLDRKQGYYDLSKLFLIKLTFRFTMLNQYLTSKK